MRQRKTLRDVGSQWDRLYRRIMDKARVEARQAHPATEGNLNLVRNWGNPEAREAWARGERRADRARAAYERTFDVVEHSRHGDAFDFHPLWCDLCKNGGAR